MKRKTKIFIFPQEKKKKHCLYSNFNHKQIIYLINYVTIKYETPSDRYDI